MTALYEDRARPLHMFDELIKQIVGDQTWKERAACKGLDVKIFYPERGEDTSKAKEICETCAVKTECGEFAITNNEQYGFWGGLALRARRRASKETTTETEGIHQ